MQLVDPIIIIIIKNVIIIITIEQWSWLSLLARICRSLRPQLAPAHQLATRSLIMMKKILIVLIVLRYDG